MSTISIDSIEEGQYKEITFYYKNLRFVYKYIVTSGWDDGQLIDLNRKGEQLSETEFEELQDLITQLDISDINDAGVDIEI